MRFFFFILFFSSCLFSADPLIDEPYPDVSTAPKTCPATATVYDSTLEKSKYTNRQFPDGTPTLGSWVLDNVAETTQRYIYYYYFEYYYSNYAHIRYVTATNYCSVCEEETEPLSTLPAPPASYSWELVAYKSCLDSLVNGDYSLYEDANETMRATTSQYVGCCGTSINYYIAVPISCEDNQTMIDGSCYDNCGDGLVIVDGQCLAYDSCRDGYTEMSVASDWNLSNSEACVMENNIDGVPMYDDIYPLFPDSVEEEYPTCCFIPYSGSDSNTTDSNTTDSNTTDSDTSDSDTLEKLDDIKESIDSSSATNHEDLTSVQNSIDSSSATNHDDLTSVQNSIDSSSATNHEDLEAVKDSIDSLVDGKSDSLDPSKNGIGDIVSQLNDIVSDATTTIPQKFNQLYNYSFGTAPVFTVSSGSCVFESDTNTMGYIKFDLNPYIAMMRPYTTLMFTLLFIFISVSWWYKAFKIIISVVF